MWGWDRELPAPGVQDPEEADEVPAQVLLVPGECLDGLRGGPEEGARARPRMAAHERPQGRRHGEGDQAMVPGQGAGEPMVQPHAALGGLALRAVPVPAGTEAPVHLPALAARVARHPPGRGAAGQEGLEDFAVHRGDGLAMGGQVLGAEGPEELTELAHGPTLPGRRQ
jgi:hypothetical protein